MVSEAGHHHAHRAARTTREACSLSTVRKHACRTATECAANTCLQNQVWHSHLTHDRLQLRTDTSSSSEYVRASERTLPALPRPQLFVGLRSGLLSGVATPSGQGSSSGARDPTGARFSFPPEGSTTTSRQASSLASRLVAAPESWSRRRLTRWKTPPALTLRRRRLPDSGMLGF